MAIDAINDELLQRYFDDEVSAEERGTVEMALASSARHRSRLLGLRRLRHLLRRQVARGEDHAVDSTAAFAELERRISGAAVVQGRDVVGRSSEVVALGATAGAPSSAAIPVPLAAARQRRYANWWLAGSLAAAASLWWVLRPSASVDGATGVVPARLRGASSGVATHPKPHGSKVTAARFVDRSGTVFELQGGHGESFALVWIDEL